jgi:hypothetical protein
MLINKYQCRREKAERWFQERAEQKQITGGAHSSCTAEMKVYACHRLMIAQNATDHVEPSSHTWGSMMVLVANSRFMRTDLKEGALLSMIGWEKELTRKSNLKRKLMLAFLMSCLCKVPKSRKFIVHLWVSINAVRRD